jgi:hypothetical protein
MVGRILRDKKKWSTDLTGREPKADRQGSAYLLGKIRRARETGNDRSRDVAIWVAHGVAPPAAYSAEDTPFRGEINTPGSVFLVVRLIRKGSSAADRRSTSSLVRKQDSAIFLTLYTATASC